MEIRVRIGETDNYSNSAKVCCMKSNDGEYLALAEDPDNRSIHRQAKAWVDHCKENHPEYGNLR